jgi:hypothetical protein
MPNTYTLIASATVGSGGASTIDFTSIPSTQIQAVTPIAILKARVHPPYLALYTQTVTLQVKP